MDQDNFSNVSWGEERRVPPAQQPGHPVAGPGPGTGIEEQGETLAAAALEERLECLVGSPLKENDGSKDAFVSYLITTHSTFASFEQQTTSIRRRFTDFVFVWKQLVRDYPASAVPPLPDKQRIEYVRGDRFGPDFTLRRAHSLQRFLARCALHPVLRRAPILHVFLESRDWNATMRSRASRASMSAASEGSSVFDGLADTFINAFTKMHRPDRRFVEVRERSDKLDDDLGSIEKVVARVVRRQADVEADLRDVAEQFERLVALEPALEPAAHAFAAAVLDQAVRLRSLREATDQDYLGSLRDMQAYSLSLRSLLRARDQKQLDHEQLIEYLNKSTSERDALSFPSTTDVAQQPSAHHHHHASYSPNSVGTFLRSKIEDVRGVDHEQARRERARRLELRVDQLTAEVERAALTSDAFDDQVVHEVADFERIKRAEFKAELGAFAEAHVLFYAGVADIWQSYVADMERQSTD
ncbi:hypothetical protein CDD82_657 [Ophiocordyceps australis]|uniref:Sorting nexin-4 n=1 Tax=Ophiocordyceps australis TaxID=1399860 RepID=A0A2C5XQW4_9HYPO|nr:hypothetical protein CDD82_657 [Ophiocordyceps australis]